MQVRLKGLPLRGAAVLFVALTAGCDEQWFGGDLTDPGAGWLEIVAATDGPDMDPDGYRVSVDGNGAWPLGPNDRTTLTGLSEGSYVVLLDPASLAPNCALSSPNPQTVVVDLPLKETPRATFEVTCQARQGDLAVQTRTTGQSVESGGTTIVVSDGDLDPDGYIVRIDGGGAVPIDRDGVFVASGLSVGPHLVLLDPLSELGIFTARTREHRDEPASTLVDRLHVVVATELGVGDIQEVLAPRELHEGFPGLHVGRDVAGVSVARAEVERNASVGARGQDVEQLLEIRPMVLRIPIPDPGSLSSSNRLPFGPPVLPEESHRGRVVVKLIELDMKLLGRLADHGGQ